MIEKLCSRIQLKRSQYVALESCSALVLAAIGFGIPYLLLPPHHQGRIHIPFLTILYPLIVCGVPYLALSTCFQAGRLRDIGVEPAPILWGIVSMTIVTYGTGILLHGTAFAEFVFKAASLAHVILRAALVYWPSADEGGPAFFLRRSGESLDGDKSLPTPVPAPRSAPAIPQGQFGKRGVTKR